MSAPFHAELGHRSETILEVAHFSGGFRSSGEVLPVLKDVSFSAAKSAITALVGETGSGKTLLALCTLGLSPRSFVKTSGFITFEGMDLASLDEKAFRSVRGRRIAIVFQDARTALNPVFTIGRQIADACRLHQDVTKKGALEATAEILNDSHAKKPDA